MKIDATSPTSYCVISVTFLHATGIVRVLREGLAVLAHAAAAAATEAATAASLPYVPTTPIL